MAKQSLQETHPDLVREWDFERNGLAPTDVTHGSSKKVWWTCKACGGGWESTVNNRTNGSGCPHCSGRRVNEKNVLRHTFPDLCKEWHPTKNGLLTPDDLSFGSERTVWWLCGECGEEWQATPMLRSKHRGCPYCSGHRAGKRNNLAVLRPNVAQEWHQEKNGELLPEHVTFGSKRNVWWRCPTCTESYQAEVQSRTSKRGSGCPYCSGRRIGRFNNLLHVAPALLVEWDDTKNEGLDPASISWRSRKRVWWKCGSCGHGWQSGIANRTVTGTGCPACQSSTSLPELTLLYYFSRLFGTEHRASVQTAEGRYEADVLIKELGLVVEYDGYYWHKTKVEIDTKKTDAFINEGYHVLRIREKGLKRLKLHPSYTEIRLTRAPKEDALQELIADIQHYLLDFHRMPKEKRRQLQAMEVDVGTQRAEIAKKFYSTKRLKSLAARYPDIAKEWDFVKNSGMDPDMLPPFSTYKAWWICSACSYGWEAQISNRTNTNSQCPRCNGKHLVTEENSLAALRPDLAEEWSDRNGDLSPHDVRTGSNKVVWWTCNVCDEEWEQQVLTRSQGSNCPYCTGRFVGKNNHLQATHSDLLADWDVRLNGDIDPSALTFQAKEAVWWTCRTCQESWEARPRDKKECSFCTGRRVGNRNHLAALYPELKKEWHPEKNGELRPEAVRPGSQRKVWWTCRTCHEEWQTQISDRAKKRSGCPYCAGIKVGTSNSLASLHPQLVKEWCADKNQPLEAEAVPFTSTKRVWWQCGVCTYSWRMPVRDRTQEGKGCPCCEGKVVRELRLHYAFAADWHKEKNGVPTVADFGGSVSRKVWWKCGRCSEEWQQTIAKRREGSGCPYCAGKKAGSTNNFALLEPERAKDWHPTRNGHLSPYDVTPGSNRKVWWKCVECGEDWETMVSAKAGCPYCTGQKTGSANSLAATFPALAAEWHPEKNGGLRPTDVVPGSHKNVWWKCGSCEHEWARTVKNRRRGSKCPRCKMEPSNG